MIKSDFLQIRRTGAPLLELVLAAALVFPPTQASSKVDYTALAQLAQTSELEKQIEFFAGQGSRVVGYPGAEESALYIQRTFAISVSTTSIFTRTTYPFPLKKVVSCAWQGTSQFLCMVCGPTSCARRLFRTVALMLP